MNNEREKERGEERLKENRGLMKLLDDGSMFFDCYWSLYYFVSLVYV